MNGTLKTAAMLIACLGTLATVRLSPAQEPARVGIAAAPPPVLGMTHEAGWGGGLLSDLLLRQNGAFVYHHRLNPGEKEPKYETASGSMPPEEVARLVKAVADAGDGPGAKDAGSATFQWIDAVGKLQSRTYLMPSDPPCAGLLKMIDESARKHAAKPK